MSILHNLSSWPECSEIGKQYLKCHSYIDFATTNLYGNFVFRLNSQCSIRQCAFSRSNPPSLESLYRTSSLGFSKQSWYIQDLTWLFMLAMSLILRFMELHLKHTIPGTDDVANPCLKLITIYLPGLIISGSQHHSQKVQVHIQV